MSAPLVQMVAQRHDWDCGIAALAMYLGVTYEAALLAYGNPKIQHRGVWTAEIMRAAKTFGIALRKRRKYDFDEDDGLLCVTFPFAKDPSEHVLLLRDGRLWDTNHYEVWEPHAYLGYRKAEAGILLDGRPK